MPLGPQVASADRAAHVGDAEGREAERPQDLGRPGGRLQGERRVVAGDRGQVGESLRQVNRSRVENRL